jgi:hypothetical protein
MLRWYASSSPHRDHQQQPSTGTESRGPGIYLRAYIYVNIYIYIYVHIMQIYVNECMYVDEHV